MSGRDRRLPGPPVAGHQEFLPEVVAVGARHLDVDGCWVGSCAVVGYPREVYPGWLSPLTTYPGRLDVSVHIDPVDPVTAAEQLRKRLARLESDRRYIAEHGRLADPQAEAATEDAHELAARIARGEGRLYRVGLYLSVSADSETALAEEMAAVRALAASLLIDARPTSYRSLQGWTTTLPLGLDQLRMRRSFDTVALATSFPFASADLPSPDPTTGAAPAGVLYGRNLGGTGLVFWDRFAGENYNAVVLGHSGAGKSYFVKTELLRQLYKGVHGLVIDARGEYVPLASAVGGAVIALGAPGVRINPLDLPIHTDAAGRRSAPSDALTRQSLFADTLISVLLDRPLDPDQRTALDHAVTTTYARAGVTADRATWNRPTPLLADLAATLAAATEPAGPQLAAQLRPFTHGNHAGLFTGPTTTSAHSHLVVYTLNRLPAELRSAATLLALDSIWRQVTHPTDRRPRLVTVDEAWLLMRQHAGAEFLGRLAKESRAHWAGLTVCTQDVSDLLGSQLGKITVTNAATHILLGQANQAIDEVSDTFGLTAGERSYLITAQAGQALLCTATHRAAFHTLAAPGAESDLVRTDPAYLASLTTPSDAGWVQL